jgi:dihydrofolate reductase
MGRVVLSEFVTLDGVMEDPGGADGTERGGWAFRFRRGPAGDRFKLDELLAAEALLLGRVTYQGFAKAWPSITDDQGFAEKMNTMRKYVFSPTLPDAEAVPEAAPPVPLTLATAEPAGDGVLLLVYHPSAR